MSLLCQDELDQIAMSICRHCAGTGQSDDPPPTHCVACLGRGGVKVLPITVKKLLDHIDALTVLAVRAEDWDGQATKINQVVNDGAMG